MWVLREMYVTAANSLLIYFETSEKESLSNDRVPKASGNQGKLEGIFPVREKSGNLAIFQKSGKNQGILITQYFLYFDDTIFSSLSA